MSANLYTMYTEQFTANLQLRLQQKNSQLRGRVMEGNHVGRQASPVQYLGPVKMKAPQGRFAPKVRTDADFLRYWVMPNDRDLDQLIDSFDLLKTIIDPKSQYVTGAAAAVGREWDDQIIAAAFGTAYKGNGADATALTSESFDSGFQIAHDFGASATTGLTVAKLIEAKRLFRKNHVTDDEMDAGLTLVIGSQQEADLLKQTQVVSTDFNDKPILVDGRIKRFLGFDIVFSERLGVASSDRSVIALSKGGMYLGIWQDTKNSVSIRNDLTGEPYDLYTSMCVGATRLEPGRVLRVLCNDATGADITA